MPLPLLHGRLLQRPLLLVLQEAELPKRREDRKLRKLRNLRTSEETPRPHRLRGWGLLRTSV